MQNHVTDEEMLWIKSSLTDQALNASNWIVLDVDCAIGSSKGVPGYLFKVEKEAIPPLLEYWGIANGGDQFFESGIIKVQSPMRRMSIWNDEVSFPSNTHQEENWRSTIEN